jgi:hypothetical protein
MPYFYQLMKLSRIKALAVVCVAMMGPAGCAPGEQQGSALEGQGTYFSIVQFAQDQVASYVGQPYTLVKTVTLNGQTDSSYVHQDRVDWGEIMEVFFATDISDPRYLDRYQFEEIKDETTNSRIYYYQAKEEKLLTRTLQIVTNAENNRIKNIYIETLKKGLLATRSQKLFYTPLKTIQIQEEETGPLSAPRHLRIVYRYL